VKVRPLVERRIYVVLCILFIMTLRITLRPLPPSLFGVSDE
jgi:hypothetical protein